ncbi:MAG: DinB family protein [Reichenbachiella sp.]|uniref:DinB family protein n=1 Tax=Reichenbachiella sp. TaxID=2184521 RepID=UPI003266DF8C
MDIKPAVLQIFDQLTLVLENLSNDEYSKASEVLHDNSIGQHMRHTLEFFTCLFKGLSTGVVNYDRRERDVFLENNTLEAVRAIKSLGELLEHLNENQPLKLVRNAYDQSSDLTMEVSTNLYRELIYNVEHAVHHMALIKIGLKEIKPELVLPVDFGVASSTMKHRQAQQANA